MKAQAPSARGYSKSHSRGVVAVALGDTRELGIDVEWTGARRSVDLIASSLGWDVLGAIGPDAFYRGWTFAEAYFKAFQKQPIKALVVHAMKDHADGRAILIEDQVHLFQRRVLPGFQLSLVWKSAEAEATIPDYLELPPV